ncbi:MAG TPA: DUF2285 domain-containing protein [Mesorhizobium sp.]|jgi:hypothetical protein|nr:DUF2285 domain-containing protein [Mesorhizobium sp.]
MPSPPLAPPVADRAPSDTELTPYDHEHLITYLRLLDAEADGAEWQEVASLVLQIDAASEPERAEAAWRSHLARAHWMMECGYKHLLKPDGST